MKDEAYVKKFDEYKSIGTQWIAIFVKLDKATFFGSFGV